MKQTWSKLRARVVHVYFEYVFFMFASSCKRGITLPKPELHFPPEKDTLAQGKRLGLRSKNDKGDSGKIFFQRCA